MSVPRMTYGSVIIENENFQNVRPYWQPGWSYTKIYIYKI